MWFCNVIKWKYYYVANINIITYCVQYITLIRHLFKVHIEFTCFLLLIDDEVLIDNFFDKH